MHCPLTGRLLDQIAMRDSSCEAAQFDSSRRRRWRTRAMSISCSPLLKALMLVAHVSCTNLGTRVCSPYHSDRGLARILIGPVSNAWRIRLAQNPVPPFMNLFLAYGVGTNRFGLCHHHHQHGVTVHQHSWRAISRDGHGTRGREAGGRIFKYRVERTASLRASVGRPAGQAMPSCRPFAQPIRLNCPRRNDIQ